MREFDQSEAQEASGDQEFPVAFGQFASTLIGTDNEIWTKWLGLQHGSEKHTPSDWMRLIDAHRNQPAYQQ